MLANTTGAKIYILKARSSTPGETHHVMVASHLNIYTALLILKKNAGYRPRAGFLKMSNQ